VPTLAVITHVYNSLDLILGHLDRWLSIPKDLRRFLEFIVVDDYSDIPIQLPVADLNLRVIRVDEDIPWNQPGCRNLAAVLARARWLYLFDADNSLLPDDYSRMLGALRAADPECLYVFARQQAGKPLDPHLNCFVIEREAFFRLGPYDEDFCGNYGFDDVMFRNRWRKCGGKERLITDLQLTQLASSTTSLDRNLVPNQKLLVSKLINGLQQPSSMVRFRWHLAQSFSQTN
jgi:hypothetical protein